jgi:hypothetical protein
VHSCPERRVSPTCCMQSSRPGMLCGKQLASSWWCASRTCAVSTIIAVLHCDKLKGVDTLAVHNHVVEQVQQNAHEATQRMAWGTRGPPPGNAAVPTLCISATVFDGGNAALLQGSSTQRTLCRWSSRPGAGLSSLLMRQRGRGNRSWLQWFLLPCPPSSHAVQCLAA